MDGAAAEPAAKHAVRLCLSVLPSAAGVERVGEHAAGADDPVFLVRVPIADRTSCATRAEEVLTQLGMEHRLKHKPNQLSGGERQRVAIARALMNSPRILFADEPTGNLDAETGRQIMGVFEKLHREKGQTIVMVTHDRTLAREADRVLVLKDGRLSSGMSDSLKIAN